MPNPREAIYDVLKAKQARKNEDKKKAAAWADYEAQNRRVNPLSPLRILRRIK